MGLFSSDEEEGEDSSEEEQKYCCDTCGKEISKEEFESNGGQCTNCVVEDGAIGGGLV